MFNNGTNLEFHKVVDGIDVFAVGKQQLWDWCSWSSRGLDCGGYGAAIICYADSLRKGSYVVVESHARLGQVGKCTVVDSFGSLRAALSTVKDYLNADAQMFAQLRTGWLYAHDYEIWRVVDDGDLWQGWEQACLSVEHVDTINTSYADREQGAWAYGLLCAKWHSGDAYGDCYALILKDGSVWSRGDWQGYALDGVDDAVDCYCGGGWDCLGFVD